MQHVLQEKDMLENSIEAYLSSEEISSFIDGTVKECIGYCYEWEGESVFHLHIRPFIHAFGIVSKCLFIKDTDLSSVCTKDNVRFIVAVNKENRSVRLFYCDRNTQKEVPVRFIPGREDLYSRSKGLLEVDVLSKKHVAIVGLGSFGSQIAIELAKAGVGEFSLFDFDRVELHNLGRHSCTLKDLGRLKTDAIEEAILGKNPYASVHKYAMNIASERMTFDKIVSDVDLLICATDNNESRFVISTSLHEHHKVGIFGRAITRAAGGDVFRYKPGGPCYGCLVGSHIINAIDEEISSEEAGRRSGAIPAYASQADVNAMVQVGLSVEIEPICNLMLKLALLELSKGQNSGLTSLEDDLKYDAYIWANRRDNNFKNWHPFYKSGSKQTILKWYGITIPKDEHCPICSNDLELDLGDEYDILPHGDYSGIDINIE